MNYKTEVMEKKDLKLVVTNELPKGVMKALVEMGILLYARFENELGN